MVPISSGVVSTTNTPPTLPLVANTAPSITFVTAEGIAARAGEIWDLKAACTSGLYRNSFMSKKRTGPWLAGTTDNIWENFESHSLPGRGMASALNCSATAAVGTGVGVGAASA